MRFLSVAERELRAGARHPMTYRMRWVTAAAFIGLLAWLMWAFDGFRAPQIFGAFSTVAFFYCLLVGTARTADCLSAEKRDGTMGLLFLTNLNSLEVITGKLCSSALAAAYGLFAIFPLLALQMLIGGITLNHFFLTLLALGDCVIFSVATGFLASSICVKQFRAVATALGIVLFVTLGLIGIAAVISFIVKPKGITMIVRLLRDCSPLTAFLSVGGAKWFGRNDFWWSVIAVNGVSLLFLTIATWRVGWTWRDRPTTAIGFKISSFLRRRDRPDSARRIALRRRLLSINPYYWLGGREAVSGLALMAVVLGVIATTSFVAAPFLGRTMPMGPMSPIAGHLFAWFWAGLILHGLILYWAAMVASNRLAEDKQAGALELILSTPTSERSISRGLWLAYGRKMIFPALLMVSIHAFIICQAATLMLLDEGSFPPATRLGPFLWHVATNTPVGGVEIDWGFIHAMRIAVIVLALAALVWITLGWVGRWLGLSMKHPGFAPLVALGFCVIPPFVIWTVALYIAVKLHLDRFPDRMAVPFMTWVAVGIGVSHCTMLALWASGRLREEFRSIAMGRFQSEQRAWWRPKRSTVIRLGICGSMIVVILAVSLTAFYGYHGWKSRREWQAFQTELKQRKVSLKLPPLLNVVSAPADNFALNPDFQQLVAPPGATNAFRRLAEKISAVNPQSAVQANSLDGVEWFAQSFSALDGYVALISPAKTFSIRATRKDFATEILKQFAAHDQTLQSLAADARLPYFQLSTNQSAAIILKTTRAGITLERLEMLFQIRACARRAAGQQELAAGDLRTCFQLIRHARQMTEWDAIGRSQVMTSRVLTPIWEGIVMHDWTDTQLATFEGELAKINFLSDYTNMVGIVVRACLESWQKRANGELVQDPFSQYERGPGWVLQNRAFWLDSSVRLYRGMELALSKVDPKLNRIKLGPPYPDVNDLPLTGEIACLLQLYNWVGPYPASPVFAQTAVNQGIIACALERFRIANGKYPEELVQLMPQFLKSIPDDVVRGRPMLYENSHDGGFFLYGVGQNERDDHKNKKSSDDWVWTFPTNIVSSGVSPK